MRKKIILLSVISAVGFGMGFYLLHIYECGISVFCYDVETKANALYYGMGSLILVFFLLFLLPQTFNSWKKFAMWFVPIMVVVFAIQDDKGGGFMEIAPNSVQVFQWISILYIILSLIVIVVSFKKHK
jgi:hypothetical protein